MYEVLHGDAGSSSLCMIAHNNNASWPRRPVLDTHVSLLIFVRCSRLAELFAYSSWWLLRMEEAERNEK